MKRILPALALIFVFLPASVLGQTTGAFDWFPGGSYDQAIPTPASFLGYTIGDAFTPHHRLEAYMEAVAAASDRVSLGSYGKTNEGRKLLLLTITSPANHARIETTHVIAGTEIRLVG